MSGIAPKTSDSLPLKLVTYRKLEITIFGDIRKIDFCLIARPSCRGRLCA